MTRFILLFLAALCLAAAPAPAADWQPIEKIETYAVEGGSGLELYRSIGERGPKLGIGRVIALTSFKLTWQRDYQKRGNGCILASARPKLIITTILPRPKGPLPAPLQANWTRFIDGVAAHERVHAEHITTMVRDIEKATVGLFVEDDPDCRRIRQQMQPILGGLSEAQRQKSRDFDKVELGKGGNVEQLVLQLVNGG